MQFVGRVYRQQETVLSIEDQWVASVLVDQGLKLISGGLEESRLLQEIYYFLVLCKESSEVYCKLRCEFNVGDRLLSLADCAHLGMMI